MKIFFFIMFNANYLILARAFVLYFRIVKKPAFNHQRPYESIHKMNIYRAKESLLLLALLLTAIYINYLILK